MAKFSMVEAVNDFGKGLLQTPQLTAIMSQRQFYREQVMELLDTNGKLLDKTSRLAKEIEHLTKKYNLALEDCAGSHRAKCPRSEHEDWLPGCAEFPDCHMDSCDCWDAKFEREIRGE